MIEFKRIIKIVLFISVIHLTIFSQDAFSKVKIVASVPDLAAIAREIGGKEAVVKSLAKGYQDPHFVDAKPSYILDLNKADLLIYNGLDLEIGWLPPLVTGSRNSKISTRSSPGNLDASTLITNILEVPTSPVDRSMGDVHPGGNPHYLLDPRNGIEVAKGIAKKLSEIDPENSSYYESNFDDFKARLNSKIKSWENRLLPYNETQIVNYHKLWTYFNNWAGLEQVGTIEPKPGIPPSPKYLAGLIKKIKTSDVKLIIASNYYPEKTARLVAEKAGVNFLTLPAQVDGAKGVENYFDLFDLIVGNVIEKLKYNGS